MKCPRCFKEKKKEEIMETDIKNRCYRCPSCLLTIRWSGYGISDEKKSL